jgi:hypothetical protein
MQLHRLQYPSASFSHYWQQPQWAKELKNLDTIPDSSEILAFSKNYLETDTLANAAITELLAHMKHAQLFDFVQKALDNPSLAEPYPYCKQLLAEVLNKPNWLNYKSLEQGASFARRSGLFGLLVLRNFSLMGGYESAAVNKPLVFTTELNRVAGKRISETTEFWVNIIEENIFENTNKGIAIALKVRLVHAMARYYILKNPNWNTQLWGLPINTADMLATNLGFSLLFMKGLEKLGFVLSPTEEAGLLHLWRYLGYLQGIPTALLPNTRPEAVRLLYNWTMTQPNGDADSVALAQSLLQIPREPQFTGTKLQKWLIYEVNLSFNEFFLSKTSCRNLGLPKSKIPFFPLLMKCFVKILAIFYKNNPAAWVAKARSIQLEVKQKAMSDYGILARN